MSFGASGTQMFPWRKMNLLSSQNLCRLVPKPFGICLVPLRFRGRSRTLYICGMKEAWVRELITNDYIIHCRFMRSSSRMR